MKSEFQRVPKKLRSESLRLVLKILNLLGMFEEAIRMLESAINAMQKDPDAMDAYWITPLFRSFMDGLHNQSRISDLSRVLVILDKLTQVDGLPESSRKELAQGIERFRVLTDNQERCSPIPSGHAGAGGRKRTSNPRKRR